MYKTDHYVFLSHLFLTVYPEDETEETTDSVIGEIGMLVMCLICDRIQKVVVFHTRSGGSREVPLLFMSFYYKMRVKEGRRCKVSVL